MDRLIQVIAALSPTGLPRIIGVLLRPSMAADYAADLRKHLPRRAAESEITFLAQSKHARAMADEIRAIPLIVLSEKWVFPEKAERRDIEAARIEDELQAEMSRQDLLVCARIIARLPTYEGGTRRRGKI